MVNGEFWIMNFLEEVIGEDRHCFFGTHQPAIIYDFSENG